MLLTKRKYDSKLIILRGNCGVGKSTVAKELRRSANSEKQVAIIEQDIFRLYLLKDEGMDSNHHIELIQQTTEFVLAWDYDVIIEGTLHSETYKDMLSELMQKTPAHFVYYLDISLEESVKRHQSRSIAHKFGEEKLREWYKGQDTLGLENEKIIPETSTLEETIGTIRADTPL